MIPSNNVLQVGAQNSDVAEIKQMLRDTMGYETVVPNGIFDDETALALKQFQRKFGLPANGVADPTTQAVLYSQYMGVMSQQGGAPGGGESLWSNPLAWIVGGIVAYMLWKQA